MPDVTSSSPIVLITGGSRGIGAATARLAAARGYAVAFTYLERAETAQALVDEITSSGGTALAIQADVSLEADVLRVFGEVDARLGTLTALVNNAGVLERQMRLDEMDVRRWTRVLTTNVVGSFLCAREAVRRMSTKHGGTGGAIVNLSSMASVIGGANEYIDYAASKGAVDSMTIGLAREIATERVRVNCVRPGRSAPRSTPAAANRDASIASRPRSRCSAAASPRKWRARSCGCSRTRPATSRARSWTSAEGGKPVSPELSCEHGDGHGGDAHRTRVTKRPDDELARERRGLEQFPSENAAADTPADLQTRRECADGPQHIGRDTIEESKSVWSANIGIAPSGCQPAR